MSAGTINTHCCQCPPAACRYIGCIGADSSFGRNIIWVKIINERCCLARHILPSASLPPPLQPGNHLLCPSPSFSNKHRSRWRRPGTLALALVIIGQGLIGWLFCDITNGGCCAFLYLAPNKTAANRTVNLPINCKLLIFVCVKSSLTTIGHLQQLHSFTLIDVHSAGVLN